MELTDTGLSDSNVGPAQGGPSELSRQKTTGTVSGLEAGPNISSDLAVNVDVEWDYSVV